MAALMAPLERTQGQGSASRSKNDRRRSKVVTSRINTNRCNLMSLAILSANEATDIADIFNEARAPQDATWGARASLKISAMSVASLAERIASDIKLHLFVFIRDVTTLDRLLSFLLLDAEPCPWVRSNGAIRAAMIVYLAGRLDMRPSDIVSLLRPHKRSIASALIKTPDPDPDSYVKKVLNDSTRTLASLN